MSTRSTISMQLENGTVKTIYCHSDGYLSHNGQLLLDYYNTPEKVAELLDLGDLSVLDKNINPSPEKSEPRHDWRSKEPVYHSFDTPQKDTVIAYGRDRKETGTDAHIYPSFNNVTQKQGYDYLFTGGKWFVEMHGAKLQELTPALITED